MTNASTLFPQKSDYPESLAILDNPHKDVNLYMRLVVSSASAYFETDPFTRYLFKKRFLWVEDYMKSTSGGRFEKAIDIGCGIGFFLPTISSYANKVVALDYSSDILNYARFMTNKKNISNVDFVQGNVSYLPFPDKSFDLVVCMSVLEHFKNPEQPLRELKRVLAPGGLLIIGYPTETPLFRILHGKVSRIMPKRRKIQKIFDQEKPGAEFAAPHMTDAKTITKAINDVGFYKNTSKSIKLLPPFFKLYTINFLHAR